MKALVTFFAFLSLYGLLHVRGECMDEAEAMEKCMKEMGGFKHGVQLISDLRRSRQLCQENTLQRAMGCLEEAYNQCVVQAAKSGSRRDYSLMVDAGKWKKGMDLLCQNMDYLQEHEACMNRSLQDAGVCIYEWQGNFLVEKMEAEKTYTSDQHNSKRRLMRAACSFADGLLQCLQPSLSKHCSRQQRLACLIRDIVFHIMPQHCRRFASQQPGINQQPPCNTDASVFDNKNEDNSDEDEDEDGDEDDEEEEDDEDDGNSGYSTGPRHPGPQPDFRQGKQLGGSSVSSSSSNVDEDQRQRGSSVHVKVKPMEDQDEYSQSRERDWPAANESEDDNAKELPVQGSYSKDDSGAHAPRTLLAVLLSVVLFALLSQELLA